MTPQAQPSFEALLQQITALPLWVKQVIYAVLRKELEATLAKSTLDAFGHDDTLQLLRPQLSHAGRRELESPSGRNSPGLVRLLAMAAQEKTIIDTCIANQWTLEQCTIYLLEAIEKEYIVTPTSGIIQATIHYLANKIRLGEYLVKIGRLSVEQLDQALRTQRYIEESLGEKQGIANVLINLGYINKQDSEGILFLKEESRKAYTLGGLQLSSGGGGAPIMGGGSPELQQELDQAKIRIRQLELMCQQLQSQRG